MNQLLEPPNQLAELQQIAARVATVSDAKMVILFGSVARGEASLGSDLDLLLVLEDSANALQAGLNAEKAFTPRFYPMDFVTMFEQEYKNPKNPLVQSIQADAKVLYARELQSTNSMSNFLAINDIAVVNFSHTL
jgi:uncharacterized protein